jgi:hypothetical protein
MSRLTANVDIGSKAVTGTEGIYRSTGKQGNGNFVYSLQENRIWQTKLANTFAEVHYVYNLVIINPCRVVDKKHRHKRIKHNSLYHG